MLKSSIYKKSKYSIYPHVKNRRGVTRLLSYLGRLSRIGVEKINSEPEPIYEKEWDNLIIFDACRHDLFEEVTKGEVEKRITVGGGTPKYIENTFSERNFDDIVYVTANPWFSPEKFKNLTGREPEDVFHTIFHSYKDKWDESKSTVLPEKVLEDLKTAEKLFPEKRKIVHFLQPHHPFVGSSIDEADSEGFGLTSNTESVWNKADKGLVDREAVWDAYAKNLEFVLPFSEKVSEIIDGRTVLTSDHGNLVGENSLYGHPEDSKAKVLREVPWDVISED